VGYFMGYYTIWLAPVKGSLVPFWELGRNESGNVPELLKNSAFQVVALTLGWV
jgi:hypothetical protein